MYQATAWSVILYVVRGPRKEHLQQKHTQTISLKYPLFTAEIGYVKGLWYWNLISQKESMNN